MIGERHVVNGLAYHETLHGPMVRGACVDCGASVLVVGRTDRWNAHGLKENTGIVAPRCSTCGRLFHGAPVFPARASLPERMASRAGSGGVNCYVQGIGVPREVARPVSAVLMSREVGPDDALVPAAAAALARRTPGARMLLSVARDTTRPGLSTWLSVQWRAAGRPPTIMALWRNGKRDCAMIGSRKVTHTAIGAVGNG